MNRKRNIHVGDLLKDLLALWPFIALAVFGGIGVFYAAWKKLDPDQRGAATFAALVVIVFLMVLFYEVIRRIGDGVEELAGHETACQIIAGPQHARLVDRDGRWRTDGVIWLGVMASPGCSLTATLTVPRGVDIAWTNETALPALWRYVGVDASGVKTWSMVIPKSNAMTLLGQFTAHTEQNESLREITLSVNGKTLAGMHVTDTLSIGLFPFVGPDAMKIIIA